MASNPKQDKGAAGPLKTWIYPKNSGIRIREILNTHGGDFFGASFLVAVPAKITGTLRERKQFKSRQEAQDYADKSFGGYQKQGQEYFALTDSERREVAVNMPLLRQHGICLTDAVRFAIKRMRAAGKDKTVISIAEELLASKEARLERGDLRAHSVKDFRIRAARFTTALGGRIAAEVTGTDIKEWLVGLKLGCRTNKNFLSVIGEIFRYATQKHYVSFSPVDDLTDVDRKELCGGEDRNKEPSILTPDEAERLLRAAHATNEEFGLLAPVVLALFCGLRTEEIQRIDWSAVKLGDQVPVVTITAAIAKKRRIRHVEIPANAVAWLKVVAQMKEGLVIGKGWKVAAYQKRFQKLLKEAKFGSWEANAMRHSFGSYDYALHGDPLETSRKLGHKASDQVLFDHYRALATKEQARRYFAIMPASATGRVVMFA